MNPFDGFETFNELFEWLKEHSPETEILKGQDQAIVGMSEKKKIFALHYDVDRLIKHEIMPGNDAPGDPLFFKKSSF